MNKDLEKFRNRLIICEGQDFCGKSSVAKLLADLLNKNEIETVLTFQPGDPGYGTNATLFRSLCKDSRHNLHPLTNMFIFFADKVEQADKIIIPALNSGKTVISDRWWHSTTAYQYLGKQILEKYKMSEEIGQFLNDMSTLYLKPDIVYYFHQKIKKHNRGEDKNDMFENEKDEFTQRVINGYEKLYQTFENIKKVNTGSSAEETLKNLLAIDF